MDAGADVNAESEACGGRSTTLGLTATSYHPEAAAGVGGLDIVETYFDEADGPKSSATWQQLVDGFTWVCEFGRNSVIEFLLEHGMKADARLKGGATGLHWAA